MKRLTTLALLLLGCDDPLKTAQNLEEARILGVRVSSPTDQARLDAGQSATFEVLLAGPEGTLDARLAYRSCQATLSDRGVPACQGEAWSEATVVLNGTAISLEVPAETPDNTRLALLGVACLEGEPPLVEQPLSWTCSGNEPPLRLSFDAWTSAPNNVNRNPDLSEASVTIGGVPIPFDTARDVASCAAGAPSVEAGRAHRVEVELGDSARDAGEALQLSHFSTLGEFERHYSFVSAEAAPRTAVQWDAPNGVAAIKQYLVVRDGRGGVSWLSWSLCVR